MRPLRFGPTDASSASMRPLKVITASDVGVAANVRQTKKPATATTAITSNASTRRRFWGWAASPADVDGDVEGCAGRGIAGAAVCVSGVIRSLSPCAVSLEILHDATRARARRGATFLRELRVTTATGRAVAPCRK